MVLSVKPDMSEDYQGSEDVTAKNIPLMTGAGIRIGDPPAKVIKALGRPTKSRFISGKTPKRFYKYTYLEGTKNDGVQYQAVYTFLNDKLWMIHFSQDAVGESG